MSAFASSKYTVGQLNAIIKLLKEQAGEDGPERYLRRELTVVEKTGKWYEKNGVIYLEVTPDNTTGKEWMERLECQNFQIENGVKYVLLSSDFLPISERKIIKIAILKGEYFDNDERDTAHVRAEAYRRKWTKLNVDAACLIRESFSDEDIEAMGLWHIIVMHEPIILIGCFSTLLSVSRYEKGRMLRSVPGEPFSDWNRSCGFAFAVS